MEAQGRTTSIVLGPGQGRILEARGSVMAFKVVAATTGGRFPVMDRRLPPGGRMPPPHRHPATVEAFLVLEGSIAFVLDGQPATAVEGGFVLVGVGVRGAAARASRPLSGGQKKSWRADPAKRLDVDFTCNVAGWSRSSA